MWIRKGIDHVVPSDVDPTVAPLASRQRGFAHDVLAARNQDSSDSSRAYKHDVARLPITEIWNYVSVPTYWRRGDCCPEETSFLEVRYRWKDELFCYAHAAAAEMR